MEQKHVLSFLWLLLMAATAGFIWQQSTLPPAVSAQQSSAVRDAVVPLVGGREGALGSFVFLFIRKIAHFAEFFLLGAEGEMYLWRRGIPCLSRRALLFPLFGLAVGAADELVQVFSLRGASFLDVLLDLCGYLAAVLLLRPLFYLIARLATKRKENAPGGR